MQLLLRFYDATAGEVLMDGADISSYSVAWLRSQMGLVQQEPVLFADSVAYNIGYGNAGPDKPRAGAGAPVEEDTIQAAETRKAKAAEKAGRGRGAAASEPAPIETMAGPREVQAAKDANAHDFIAQFTHG